MSDALYNIKRWDSVIIDNTTIPYPLIYIKPDKSFLDFILIHNIIELTIRDTDSIYDNKKIIGLVRPSINTPNYRLNFYNKTGYYCIILFTEWYNYPDKLGYFTIKGIRNPETLITETFDNNEIPKIIKNQLPSVESVQLDDNDNSNIYIPGITSYGAIWTIIFIFILLITIICISYYKK